MGLFEYVMVLVSVVLSMGIGKLLESHALLLKAGKRVRWSPTYGLWLILIFASHFDLWASMWSLHDKASWNLLGLLLTLLAAASLFYAAALSGPDLEGEEPLDLWAFHLANRQRYVGALVVYAVLAAAMNVLVLTGEFEAVNYTTFPLTLGAMLLAIFVRNRWIQILAPIVMAGLLTAYFVQYFQSFHA